MVDGTAVDGTDPNGRQYAGGQITMWWKIKYIPDLSHQISNPVPIKCITNPFRVT